jgi:hypothetical protein
MTEEEFVLFQAEEDERRQKLKDDREHYADYSDQGE